MQKLRRFILAVLMVMMLMVLVGCGGAGSNSSGTNSGGSGGSSGTAPEADSAPALQGASSGGTGGSYVAAGGGSPVPGSDVHYSVPWISQVPPGNWAQTLNCGPTSEIMVESYYNKSTPTSSTIKNDIQEIASFDVAYKPDINNGDVTSSSQLVALAVRHGFTNTLSLNINTIQDLKDTVGRYGPAIVSFRTRISEQGVLHWVVVTGFDGINFYIHDPGRSAAAPSSLRENAPVAISKFWSIFSSAGSKAIFLQYTAQTSINWANYKTVYRHLDANGGRHYSVSDIPNAGYILEREAFIITTASFGSESLSLQSCDRMTDGIIASKSSDVSSLMSVGYTCKPIGYSISSSTLTGPFTAVCPVRRYTYSPASGMGAHLFTVSQENPTGLKIESPAEFFAYSKSVCY